MNFWQRFRWVSSWIGLISLLLCIAYPSGADQVLDLADSLFSLQSYQEAITEYKRFVYFHPQGEQTSYVFYKIGLACRAEQRWQEAFQALRNSIHTAQNDSLKDERRIALAVTAIASANYDPALVQLLQVSHFSRFPSLRQKALFFQKIAYIYTFNWAGARKAFDQFHTHCDEYAEAQEVDSLLIVAQHLPYKSPTLAKLFSTLLPGSGQIYVGHWRDGINALAINGLTTTFLLKAIAQEHYWDASGIFFSLFERYYLGNRRNAAEGAIDYNQQLNQRCAHRILQTLSKNLLIY